MNKRIILKIAKWTGITLLSLILLISILVYSFRKKIINYVVSELNTHLVAKVNVEKIDVTFWGTFPCVSVDFNKVLIFDTIQQTNDTVLYADLVRLEFDALKLWNKKYVLEKANISSGVAKLVEYKDGRENYMIFKTSADTTTSTPIEFKLQAIQLQDFKLSYNNKITKQFYSTVVDKLSFNGDFQAEKFDLKTKAKLTVLAIKDQDVTLLKNKKTDLDFSLIIDKKQDVIQIPKSTIIIENLPFDIKARFTDLGFLIGINGQKLPLEGVINNLFADKDILKYKGKGMVDFNLEISDDNSKLTPVIVDCRFKVNNGQLTEPSQNITLTNINVEGEYSNKKGVGNEYISLKTFDFQSQTGPFSGRFLMTNFSNPRYQGTANGAVNLGALSQLIHVQELDYIKGLVYSKLQFDVSTHGETFRINNLSGDMQLSQTELKLTNDTRVFSDINGAITFNQNEAFVQGFNVKLGKSDLVLNGEFRNIEQFLSNNGSILVNAELKSNYIDVQDLNLDSENTISNAVNVSERVYQLPVNVSGNLNVNIGKLKYKKHEFTDLRSQLTLSGHQLIFSGLNVENGGTAIAGNLTIHETSPEYFMVTTNLRSNEINFKRLFKEWNNFEQSVLKEENINGNALVSLDLKAPFDLRKGILMQEIVSNINVKITNGTLENVGMFRSIMGDLKKSATKMVISKKQLTFFEQRLMNLKFDVLENNFTIVNGKVTIPEMKINSNALDLTLSGWHTFDNQIDYRFSFRFRDVKTFDKDSEFGIIEDDGTGFLVFMKMTGTLDNPIIAWDKTASKEQQKQNRENAKKEALSMFKSEFGIGKKDSTIQYYQAPKKKEVEVEVDFSGKQDEPKPKVEEKSKLQKTIDKKVEEAKKQKQQEVEFEIE